MTKTIDQDSLQMGRVGPGAERRYEEYRSFLAGFGSCDWPRLVVGTLEAILRELSTCRSTRERRNLVAGPRAIVAAYRDSVRSAAGLEIGGAR